MILMLLTPGTTKNCHSNMQKLVHSLGMKTMTIERQSLTSVIQNRLPEFQTFSEALVLSDELLASSLPASMVSKSPPIFIGIRRAGAVLS